MGTGPADSWYHEKESAWLYGVAAAAEPDLDRRALRSACSPAAPPFVPALAVGKLLGASLS
jgi:hypothetical protein